MVLELERGEHKGENGKVLIVGGSQEYVGCLSLAGLAALRTGVDLVYIAAPEEVAWAINSYAPDLITIKLPGSYLGAAHLEKIEPWLEKSDAILLGTGAGQNPGTKELIRRLAEKRKPKVIDADGLRAIDPILTKNSVLTPHSGEFETLFGGKPNKSLLLKYSRPDRIILLKGKVDLISDGRNVYENKTGNSGMTVGGTGDVLAGVVAGLLAQGLDFIDAARMGARINGLAGDLAFNKFGYSLLASDLLNEIPSLVMKEVWKA